MPQQCSAPIAGYQTAGDNTVNKPAVILLHSSLSSSAQFKALVSLLHPHYYCLNIDLLGYGHADEVSDQHSYNLDTEVNRVMAIVNREIADRPFALVGHSYGGAIGLRIAHQAAARVVAMAMYEPVAFHLLDHLSEGYQEIDAVRQQLIGQTASQSAEIFVDYWNHEGFYQRCSPKSQQRFAAKMAKVLLDFRALMGQSYQLEKGQLSHCQFLLIEGQSSRMSAKALLTYLRAVLPNVEHQMFVGGHMAPLNDSEAIAAVIAKFILTVLK